MKSLKQVLQLYINKASSQFYEHCCLINQDVENRPPNVANEFVILMYGTLSHLPIRGIDLVRMVPEKHISPEIPRSTQQMESKQFVE